VEVTTLTTCSSGVSLASVVTVEFMKCPTVTGWELWQREAPNRSWARGCHPRMRQGDSGETGWDRIRGYRVEMETERVLE
jgi:hypothetical protein